MHRNLGVLQGERHSYRLFSQWQGKANGFTKGEIVVFILVPNNTKLLE
jgi:hypothetical protein